MLTTEISHPTIDDVARLAGVSTATVSRVLNRPESVSESLRKKVAAAVARLGYVPHAGARALMLRRSGTVGAVFPTVDNAIFATAIDALQRRLAQSDIQLLIATSGYDVSSEMRQAINLVTRGADALVLCGFCQHPDLLRFMHQRRLPCVHVMVHEPSGEHISVGFDNAAAMAQATQYLIDLGHRRIAMLAGVTQNNDRALQRVEGVRRTLQAAGLDLPGERLVERPYALADARDGLRELMAHRPAPTAVICGNDVLAFGAMLEAASLDLQVPHDLSIVGFDDLEMARHLQPALTTVRVPTEAMWSTAADRLVAAIRGEPVQRSTKTDVALVVRQSTGPVRTV
jgi:LacI family transcriptional regulator